jgi:NAD(P)-dependent dehydrogenase (short-subunit alcohol dehydrogenase family)
MYVATTIAGTILAGSGTSLESLAATATATAAAATRTNGLSLVSPSPNTTAAAALQGQIIVITGATTGIGLESGKALAKGGATVVLTARTDKKGATAVQTVQNYLKEEGVQNSKVYFVQLDLDSLDNVKSFPKRFQEKLGDAKIDTVLNNAGVMAIPELELTQDGYERTFQSNHLGHFALLAKLFPYLNENAKIINVSSLAYLIAGKGLDLNNLNGEKEYGAWSSYGQSKLENILFTQELQRRADAAGISITATCLHPGGVNTDLARNMMGGEDAWFDKRSKGPVTFWEKALDATITKALLTPAEGAATQVYLATTNTAEKGRFYSDLKAQTLPAFATDEKAAKALWERSEQLAGVTFTVERKQNTP